MFFGADYYPEHWEEERWQIDASLMKRLNFNIVRLAEFAWVKMEPEEGIFNFGWLDKAVSILSKQGISVVLCTPTAAPPHWLTTKHPEILSKDEKGVVASTGGRRHYCQTNIVYHDYCRKIVTAMAKHYKRNKAIKAWHIDNEFGGRCYCENCAREFRNWLKRKYRSLDNLNKAWGTVFWSRTFTDWNQIPLPWNHPYIHSPHARLDFSRFSSESFVRFQQIQLDIIRKEMPQVPITHNFMQEFVEIDYYDLAKNLDFISCDVYPGFGNSPAYAAIVHDMARGLKGGKPFWVMEQQVGPVNWKQVNTLLRPGIPRLWTYQAISHGAEGVVYFRWRCARFGHEQFHSGILPHSAEPGRTYKEIEQLGSELKKVMPELDKTAVNPEAALILDYPTAWFIGDAGTVPNKQVKYLEMVNRYYRALFALPIQSDIVSPKADLLNYKLVIAPLLTLIDDKTAKNLKNYVKKGGFLILTLFSGICDESGVVFDKPFPGPLSDVAGIKVREFDPIPESFQNEVGITGITLNKGVYKIEKWCDIIEPQKAKTVATYSNDFYKGNPAITLNKFGKGHVLYIGTIGKDGLEPDLIRWAAEKSGIKFDLEAKEGLEIRSRKSKDSTYYFVLNHHPLARNITVPEKMKDIISGKIICGKETIPPYGVLILKTGIKKR